uniref:Uncharacterized protein n=1 Tax=Avena sativa TaxID=4498 RepID=A0ACD6ACB8_AVESA
MITLASTLPAVHSWNNFSSLPSSQKVVLFYTSLYLIAVAQGVGKPCGLAFAADQFDPDHPKERAARSSLFNWFYLCMVIGVAMAVTVVSSIQENIGWGIGFGALFVIMVFASLVFLAGTTTYRLYTPTTISSKSPITRLAHSFSALARNSIFSFLMKEHHQREDEKDMDKSEEARAVLRMLPIWVTCLAFGLVFAQVPTLFNKQGRTLDLRMFGALELPPAGLRTFGPVSILVFMPIYDRVLVPVLRCATGNPSGLTPLQRMGMGMALSLVAVSVAALVESRRLVIAREYGLVDDASATVPMSWVWLVPQYVICGMSDVFAVVGMREFFYDQMPDDLRSLGLALSWGVMGVSSFISGALISLIDRVTKSGGGDSWFADNLNRAHLDYFYWLLAGVSAVELVLYLHFTSSYAYIGKRLHR